MSCTKGPKRLRPLLRELEEWKEKLKGHVKEIKEKWNK
jgi:hypothetical protein